MNETPTLFPLAESPAELAARPIATPINILEAAVRGGVTAENVAVVKELVQMCRDQRAEEAKVAFAKAFFQLRKNMPEIHADKEAKTRSGETAYTYCSESEIARMLEPHLMSYGFAMLFGQSEHDGRITVNVTLMHESGHQEVREFTVRAGSPNAMKDAASCDAGGATTAWRHLMIKMFGLKSRIAENQGKFDASIEGEKISPDRVQYLREQIHETGSDEAKFLKLAGVAKIEDITAGSYDVLVRALAAKARAK
jgi:hypothetical protein